MLSSGEIGLFRESSSHQTSNNLSQSIQTKGLFTRNIEGFGQVQTSRPNVRDLPSSRSNLDAYGEDEEVELGCSKYLNTLPPSSPHPTSSDTINTSFQPYISSKPDDFPQSCVSTFYPQSSCKDLKVTSLPHQLDTPTPSSSSSSSHHSHHQSPINNSQRSSSSPHHHTTTTTTNNNKNTSHAPSSHRNEGRLDRSVVLKSLNKLDPSFPLSFKYDLLAASQPLPFNSSQKNCTKDPLPTSRSTQSTKEYLFSHRSNQPMPMTSNNNNNEASNETSTVSISHLNSLLTSHWSGSLRKPLS